MGAKGKNLICECGGRYSEQSRDLQGITCPVMVCGQCDEIMFSMEQSRLYHKLRSIQDELSREHRKISRVGNSMGITLPVKLKELGFEIGRNFNFRILDDHRVMIELQP